MGVRRELDERYRLVGNKVAARTDEKADILRKA